MATATKFNNSDDFNMDDLADTDELNKSIKALAEAILKYNAMVNVVIRTSANKTDDGSPFGPLPVPPHNDNASGLASTIRNEIDFYRRGSDKRFAGYESEESKDNYNNDIQNYRIINSTKGSFIMVPPKDSVKKTGVSVIDSNSNRVRRFPGINNATTSIISGNTRDQPSSQNTLSDIPAAETVLKEGQTDIKITQDNTGNINAVTIFKFDGTSKSYESMEEALENIPPVIYDRVQSVVDEITSNPTVQSTSTPYEELLDASIDILSPPSDNIQPAAPSSTEPFTNLSDIPVIREAQELINRQHKEYRNVGLGTTFEDFIPDQTGLMFSGKIMDEASAFSKYQSALRTVAYGEIVDASIDILLSLDSSSATADIDEVDNQDAAQEIEDVAAQTIENVAAQEIEDDDNADPDAGVTEHEQSLSNIPYESLLDISIDILSDIPTPTVISVDDQMKQNNIIITNEQLESESDNKINSVDIGSPVPNENIPPVVLNSDIMEDEIDNVVDNNRDMNGLGEGTSNNLNNESSNSDETTTGDAALAINANPELARTPELVESVGVQDSSNDELSSQDEGALANSPEEVLTPLVDVALGNEATNISITNTAPELKTRVEHASLPEGQLNELNDTSLHDNEVEIVELTKPPAPVVDLVPNSEEQAEIDKSNKSIDDKLEPHIDEIKKIMMSNVYISEKTFKDIIQEYGGLDREDTQADTKIDNYIENKMDKYKYDNDGKYIKAEHDIDFKSILRMLNKIKNDNNEATVNKIIQYYNDNIKPKDTFEDDKIATLLTLVNELPTEIKNETDKITPKEYIIATINKIRTERKYINIKHFIGDLKGDTNTETAKYDIIETIGKYSSDSKGVVADKNQNVIQKYIEKSITKNMTEISTIANNFDTLQKYFRQIQLTKDKNNIYKIKELEEKNARLYNTANYVDFTEKFTLDDMFNDLKKLQSANEPTAIFKSLLLILQLNPEKITKICENIYTHVINLMSVILYLFKDELPDTKLVQTTINTGTGTDRVVNIKSLDKILLENSSFNQDKESSSYIKPNMIVYDYFDRNRPQILESVNYFNKSYNNLKTLLNSCLKIIEYVLKGSTVRQNNTVDRPTTSIIGSMLKRSDAYNKSGVAKADLNMIDHFLLDLNTYKTNMSKDITNLDHLHTYGNELYDGIKQYNEIYSKDEVFQTDKENKVVKYIKPEPVPKKIDPRLNKMDLTTGNLDIERQQTLLAAPTGKNKPLAPLRGNNAKLAAIEQTPMTVKSPRDTLPARRNIQPVSLPSGRLLSSPQRNPRNIPPERIRKDIRKDIRKENTWELGE